MRFRFLIILLFSCLTAYPQYSTDKFGVEFSSRRMPRYYVPENDRVFSLILDAPRQVKRAFETVEELERFYVPKGWGRDRENPYLKIIISADYLVIDKIYEIEEVEKIRDREGEKEVSFFRPAMDYHIPITITAVSPQGRTETDNFTKDVPREPIVFTIVAPEKFKNPIHAHNFILDNKEIIIEREIRNRIFELYDSFIPTINNSYVYMPEGDFIHVWLLDNKKNSFYPKYKYAKEEIRNIFSRLNYDGGLSEVIRDIKPYIDLIIEEVNSLNESDKKQKSAKTDLLCALAEIYYGLEIFDVSAGYAEKTIALGDSRGNKILKKISHYKDDLAKHHIQSKHFTIEE